jgi:flavorubredoxin
MDTTTHEIANDIFRISTFVPEVGPMGLTFNQFLIRADEPLLFHTGPRAMFPAVRGAVAKLLPPQSLKWITFGHVESDECGSMNEWLEVAPQATVAHGEVGCMVSLNDLANRPPRALQHEEVLDLGGKRVRHLDTPHVPHCWDARVLFEETTRTLFCGDLFTHVGKPSPVTSGDIVGPAREAEAMFHASCLTPTTGSTIRSLASLEPAVLGLMHGSSFNGECAQALQDLANVYDELLAAAAPTSMT